MLALQIANGQKWDVRLFPDTNIIRRGRNLKPQILTIFITLSLLTVTACQTTFEEGRQNLANELKSRGTNPYIKAPVLKDLERRIRGVVMKPQVNSNPNDFDPRNFEILSNFQDRYDHQKMMTLIALSATGYDRAAETLYSVPNSGSSCSVHADDAVFPVPDKNSKFKTWDWEFVKGGCNSGRADGIAEARSRDGTARFTGRFYKGKMYEGVLEGRLEDGDKFINIGNVPSEGVIARLLTTIYRKSGYKFHRFGDINSEGKLDGFGMDLRNYTDLIVVRSVGEWVDDKKEGFGAWQDLRKAYDHKVWNTWIGTWHKGKMHGLGAWTNAHENIQLGEFENGKAHGLSFTQYSDMTGDYHAFGVGQRSYGKRHGPWQYNEANTFNSNVYVTEVYNNGNMVSTSDRPAFTFNQVMAFAIGAATLSVADVPTAAKLQVGTAFAKDTLGNGDGANLAALKQSFASHARSNGKATHSSGSTKSVKGGITVEQVVVNCPHSGPHTIPVPYRDRVCRAAAIDFATTYVCNKLDQSRVIQRCIDDCGQKQCLQE